MPQLIHIMEIPSSPWRKFKAKVIERFGTIQRATSHFDCSPAALRQAVENPERCRKVRRKLERAGLVECTNAEAAAR